MNDPVGYMERSRRYYAAQGFDAPYVWAHFDEVPFAPLTKPLGQSVVTVVTTASLSPRQTGAPRAVASFSSASVPDRLYADDLFWDRQATHLDDVDAFVPASALRTAVAAGRIGQLAERFHCAPTEYSIRRTVEVDAPEILRRCREDHADIALLVPL